jgi:type I restriction enzyme S subunit
MTFAKGKTAHVYIRVTDMKDNTIKLSDLKYIDDYVYEHIKNYTINASDLYLTIAGTIGSVGIVPNEVDGMNLTENAAKLTQIGCIKEYLLYALLSTIAQEHFIFRFHQVAQPKLSIETASKTPIAMPPIGEQNRIVKEIKRYLAAIKIIEEGQTDLETTISQAKSKILDLAIHGKLVPQDPTDEPAAKLLKRINPKAEIACDNGHYQKNEQFEIPSTWVLCKLGAVNEIARGGSPRPIKDYLTNDANSINWIKIGDTTKDGKYINSVKEKIRPEGVKKSRLVHKGDFLLTNSMSYGRPYILNVDGCIHDGWLVISPIGKAYTSDFLYYLLSSSFAYDQFTNVASGGVVTNLNSDKVADTIFPLPPYTEQERIVAKIEEIFAQLDAIEASL